MKAKELAELFQQQRSLGRVEADALADVVEILFQEARQRAQEKKITRPIDTAVLFSEQNDKWLSFVQRVGVKHVDGSFKNLMNLTMPELQELMRRLGREW